MTSDKKPRECICHASWSGYDEAEYRARGCPECECWKIEAYDAKCREVEELVEALSKYYVAHLNEDFRAMPDCLKSAEKALKEYRGESEEKKMSIKIPERPKILPLDFDKWWDKEIQPLVDALENLTVVTSANGRDWNEEDAMNNKFQALLIDMQEIEKDSCEKFVKDWLEQREKYIYNSEVSLSDFVKRAKRLLEKDSKEGGE